MYDNKISVTDSWGNQAYMAIFEEAEDLYF